MKRSVVWLSGHMQQGVFMRVGNFPSIARTGAKNYSAQRKDAKPKKERLFVVGKSIVGGEEVVGCE